MIKLKTIKLRCSRPAIPTRNDKVAVVFESGKADALQSFVYATIVLL